MKAIPVCKRKAKLVQNHQPGHVIAATASSCPRQTFVVQINPRRARDRGQGPKSAPYIRHHLQAKTRDRLSSTASPLPFHVPNNAPRTPAPQSFPLAIRTPRTAPLFFPCACVSPVKRTASLPSSLLEIFAMAKPVSRGNLGIAAACRKRLKKTTTSQLPAIPSFRPLASEDHMDARV